jgi:hypothetical protein
MNYPATSERSGVFRDARLILDIAEVTPGIPFPCISKDRAVFFFVGITHAKEAAEAVADAREILGYALKAAFCPRRTQAGSTRHYVLTAVLPSGLMVEIVALSEHIDSQPAREDARELKAMAA